MRTNREIRWALSGLCLLMGATLFGCSGTGEVKGLRSSNPLVRKAAIERMGERQSMEHYGHLVMALQTDPDRLVRSQAAFAIGRLSQRYYSVGFEPLAQAVESDTSAFVRAAAALSLSATSESRAVPVLVAALSDDARGEMTIDYGKRAVTYKACPADAARTSLERIVGREFASDAEGVEAKRSEMATLWDHWYSARQHHFPNDRALARK